VSDFLESAKQKVGQAINRASWETQKRLRINSKQNELNKLKEERESVVESLTSAVMLLYRQGRLTDPQLRQYCERLVEMERETMLVSAQLEQIRAETYEGQQSAGISGMVIPGMPSINPFPVPPTPPSSTPKQGAAAAKGQPAMVPCPTCGELVRAQALFCNKCGTKLH
jgi:hypothetical protein